jgi:acyl-CoA synthetase (AMP-forming)/AMP-acid ligase II
MSYEVKALSPDVATPVPIGKACANTEIFALTSDGKVVKAPGESGELYARGPTVMQGYWNDPQKTEKVLVQNPLNPNFEEKVVRTGDIVTLGPDGNYLYLGRQDGMIKTRGYRVELGEIEAVLYSNPGISEAVVVPIRDELIGNRLFAFVSVRKNSTLTKEGIFAFCGSKLPKYMVPESITIKETLPKTSSGKMDRVALANSIVQGVRE